MHTRITIIILLTFIFILPDFLQAEEPLNDLQKTELALQLKDLQSKAMFHFYKKNVQGADLTLQQIKAIAPDSIEYYYISGLSAYVKKDYPKSIELLGESIKLNPEHELSLYLMGMSYSGLNDWKSSLGFFEKASSVTYNPYYQMNLAIAYLYNNNLPKAIISAKRAIELKANYDEAKMLLSRLLLLNDQKDEAYSLCTELKATYQTETAFAFHCARMAFAVRKDYQEVIDILGKTRMPDLETRRLLAGSWFHLNHYKNAEPLYRTFIYSPVATGEEGLEYLEILLINGPVAEIEKFKNYFTGRHPELAGKALKVIELAEIKRDSLKNIYYQFKQTR